jgi:ubiquinone/menaquinone biosynthesis C-methylase UbiE
MSNTAAYPLKYALKTVNNPNGRILEVGCGPGRILRYFQQNRMNIVGVDYVASILRRLKSEESLSKLIIANVIELPFPDYSFDYLLAFGVYHGFSDRMLFDGALREACRVVDIDGLICISVRADSYHNRLIDWYKRWKQRGQKSSHQIIKSVHKLSFNRNEFESALKQAGFKVEQTELTSNMPVFYQFRLFRTATHREFNESLGRREGYKLIFPIFILYRLLTIFFPYHASNVIVSIARRMPNNTNLD